MCCWSIFFAHFEWKLKMAPCRYMDDTTQGFPNTMTPEWVSSASPRSYLKLPIAHNILHLKIFPQISQQSHGQFKTVLWMVEIVVKLWFMVHCLSCRLLYKNTIMCTATNLSLKALLQITPNFLQVYLKIVKLGVPV